MKNGSLREVQSEIGVRPSQDEELKGGAGAPKERCHGQGDLTLSLIHIFSPQPPRLEDAFMSLLIAADKPQKDFGENAGIENTKIDDPYQYTGK